MLLAGRLVDEGRVVVVDVGRCDVAVGRLATVGRLVVVVVGRLVVAVGRALLPEGLTLLTVARLEPAVLAVLGVLLTMVRELIEPAVLLRRTLAT